MKNKKINIVLFICLILFLSINSMAIGVNDSSLYITRAEFDTKIADINTKISTIEPTITAKVNDFYTANPLTYVAGTGITVELNTTNNRYNISLNLNNATQTFPSARLTVTTTTTQIFQYTFTQDAIAMFSCTLSPLNSTGTYANIRLITNRRTNGWFCNCHAGWGWATAAITGPSYMEYVKSGHMWTCDMTMVGAQSVVSVNSFQICMIILGA
ncbi:MAG: hypothetical protein Q4F88_06560 [Eubacteriales bacterium]|nr:hypothetical protein [Eubacteriales bacterium]